MKRILFYFNQNKMEGSPEFVSYKKVVVFGAVATGKTTLTKSIEKGVFTNETHTENGKILNKLIIK